MTPLTDTKTQDWWPSSASRGGRDAAPAHATTDLWGAPPFRVVLVSIVAFWTLYFAILTIRALAIFHMHSGMLNRAIVSLASMGVTLGFYWLLRRVPINRLGLAIAIAALVAAPAALVYSTINYAVFEVWLPTMPAKVRTSHKRMTIVVPPVPSAPPAMPVSSANGMIPVPPPPAAPRAPTVITVGSMDDQDEMAQPSWMSIADQAANGYFFFASWAALYLALCYAGEVGRLARRASALRAAAQASELRALRYQVNPHFLFNTLNSLSSLVMTGKRDQAEQMIINLAAFFRTSLTGDPTEDVLLSEEIALQRLYLEIEATRFPDRLAVVIDLPEALASACVPGLILQPLVENAVKHGVSRTRRPVTLRIAASRVENQLMLRVEDDGDGALGQDVSGTGLGLANVRDRLHARYGEDGWSQWGPLAEGGFGVTLRLPLRLDGC